MTTKVTRNMLNTSIDDNGNATAITIDSSENTTFSGDVEVGTTAPKINLKNTDTSIVADQSLGVIEIESTDGSTGSAGTIAKLDIAASGAFDGSGHGSEFRFSVGATNQSGSIALTEAMRLDSSGRLLIGLTETQNAASFSGRNGDALQVKGGEGVNAKATTNGGGCFVALGSSGNTAGSYFVSVNTSGSVDFRVAVGGALSKSSGSFKIEHPLESKKDTHNLVHSFIEGPQADLIYRGVAVLENGTASINLDTAAGMTEGTFVLLNTNTSCFASNESDWDAVKGNVSGNTLTISCQNTSSTATVSWLVIGERHDQHMKDTDWTDNNGKVIVEPLKEQPYQ